MIKLEMKNCNTLLTGKKQKHQHHQAKLIHMNILQANKYYLLIKVK